MLHRIGGAVGTPERPLMLVFDEEAVKSVERFLTDLQEEIRGTEGAEAACLGKGRGTVVRLAAILALLDWSRHAATARPPGTVGRRSPAGSDPPVARITSGRTAAPCSIAARRPISSARCAASSAGSGRPAPRRRPPARR